MTGRLSAIRSVAPQLLTSAELVVETRGEGFTDITGEARHFVEQSRAGDGVLLLYLRHTSASLVIQENADPDVQTDLVTALRRVAPADGPWVHTVEGPDDMPGHIKTMLTGVTLHVPVRRGVLELGTWQGIYLVEHRTQPHRRELILQFIGSRA
jgi:secondary thiamine-phosphate synthase enzyme